MEEIRIENAKLQMVHQERDRNEQIMNETRKLLQEKEKQYEEDIRRLKEKGKVLETELEQMKAEKQYKVLAEKSLEQSRYEEQQRELQALREKITHLEQENSTLQQ